MRRCSASRTIGMEVTATVSCPLTCQNGCHETDKTSAGEDVVKGDPAPVGRSEDGSSYCGGSSKKLKTGLLTTGSNNSTSECISQANTPYIIENGPFRKHSQRLRSRDYVLIIRAGTPLTEINILVIYFSKFYTRSFFI